MIAQPLLHLAGVVKDRKSQKYTEKEAIPKHLGSMTGVLIMSALVGGVTDVAHVLMRIMSGVR